VASVERVAGAAGGDQRLRPRQLAAQPVLVVAGAIGVAHRRV